MRAYLIDEPLLVLSFFTTFHVDFYICLFLYVAVQLMDHPGEYYFPMRIPARCIYLYAFISICVFAACFDLAASPLSSALKAQKNAIKNVAATVPKPLGPAAVHEAFPAVSKAPSTIKELQDSKELILAELAHYEVYVRSYSVEADGTLSYLSANIAGKGKKVIVQQDYVNYKLVPKGDSNQKVGIVFRVQAELVTKSANVNLNGLFAIGLAVNAGAAAGTLRVEVHGLSGEPINSILPLPSSISEDSLQNAMQSVATLKSKIYDSKVYIIPQIIPDPTDDAGNPS